MKKNKFAQVSSKPLCQKATIVSFTTMVYATVKSNRAIFVRWQLTSFKVFVLNSDFRCLILPANFIFFANELFSPTWYICPPTVQVIPNKTPNGTRLRSTSDVGYFSAPAKTDTGNRNAKIARQRQQLPASTCLCFRNGSTQRGPTVVKVPVPEDCRKRETPMSRTDFTDP